MSEVIDLNYIKKEQERFAKHLETTKGIKYQEGNLKITEGQILHLQSELFEVLNETKIHKEYDDDVDRNKLLEELSDCLSCIGNIANSIDVDLIINTEIRQVSDLIKQFRELIYDTSRLDKVPKIGVSRRKLKEIIVPNFINMVYSLGFNLDELREAYFRKMKKNYLNPKFK
ncbi:dUTP diphosphatase [Paraclostridium bifermentans]|uniref:dUTP diphosphatase n=1 Tax=Paraclostridium bifermentans TaxID=1490 RepID=UPI001F2BE03F|nr:dUTP diphosphatase [Paraclostridium bifermentans]MCE9676582.1 dUTP diphosphatase [Paraclostridium bifermentans]